MHINQVSYQRLCFLCIYSTILRYISSPCWPFREADQPGLCQTCSKTLSNFLMTILINLILPYKCIHTYTMVSKIKNKVKLINHVGGGRCVVFGLCCLVSKGPQCSHWPLCVMSQGYLTVVSSPSHFTFNHPSHLILTPGDQS